MKKTNKETVPIDKNFIEEQKKEKEKLVKEQIIVKK